MILEGSLGAGGSTQLKPSLLLALLSFAEIAFVRTFALRQAQGTCTHPELVEGRFPQPGLECYIYLRLSNENTGPVQSSLSKTVS